MSRLDSDERRAPFVPARKFIEVWQTSETVAEVMAKLKMRRPACTLRAKRYRDRGVPLKDLDPGYAQAGTYGGQWEDLAEYAKDLVSKKPAEEGPKVPKQGPKMG
jgi:hypothetical protein